MDETKLDDLTPEQIENYKRILTGMIGPYVFFMLDEQIQELRDTLQKILILLQKRRKEDE